MSAMRNKSKYLINLHVIGLLLIATACTPDVGGKVYPYNYDPKNPYYLKEVVSDYSVEGLSDDELYMLSQHDTSLAIGDMDYSRDFKSDKLFAPMGGMAFTPLFSEPVKNSDERFLRLELAVQTLRNDVDVLIPKVFKTPEAEVADLAGATTVVQHAKPVSIIKDSVASAPPSKVYEVVARAFRRADHKDKTRIVIDLSAEKDVSAVLSGDGKRLIVNLSGISWRPEKEWNALSGQLVSGYKLEAGDKLFIDLMYQSTISKKMLLKPNKDSSNYRLVIDLVSSHVHK